MNKSNFLLLREISKEKITNQRLLAEKMNWSLGYVNNTLSSLRSEGYLSVDFKVTSKGKEFLNNATPKNAIILAAGYGLRMVPINQNKSKAFLTVDGKPLIERQIEHLLEKGIKDITIVVGFMKESFDYLCDKYNVKLVFNKHYIDKNNLFSLECVKDKISDTYIIPCDLYSLRNPFDVYENFTWYMVNELIDEKSPVRITRLGELNYNKRNKFGNSMVGIAYISAVDAPKLKKRIEELCSENINDNEFWELALFDNSEIKVAGKVVKSSEIVEINSYEQLRDLDSFSVELQHESFAVISKVFNCQNNDITNIKTLKKGMTNRSFIFTVKEKKYIMRIPGEGTDLLINRKQEASVYNAIKKHNICDELFYINPDNGMKISSFIENSRCCDATNDDDIKKCMKKLRSFHELKIKIDHEFDIYERINFYESLWNAPSIFNDYKRTKSNVLKLKRYIDFCNPEFSLTHIDAVPDNFLFSYSDDEKEEIQLIDWEYSGMQDPHVDIAMFCIYSLYKERQQIDKVIDIYFENMCSIKNRVKIYCYIALCGLLWSNWCEYKRQLGVEFGEYSLMQYRYAKDFYKIAVEEMKNMGFENE